MREGFSIAMTSYALAAVISFVTAALMALILKVVRLAGKKR